MTLFEIIFLIMFAVFIVLIGVIAVAAILTYARNKNLTKRIEVYQKNFNEINECFREHKRVIEETQKNFSKAYSKIGNELTNHKEAIEKIRVRLGKIDEKYSVMEECIRRLDMAIFSLDKDELQLKNKEFFYGYGKPINTEIKEKKHDTRKNRSK